MKEFNPGVAYDEDVFKRALEILKRSDVEISKSLLKRIYEHSALYIRNLLKEEPYLSVNLNPIGNAYYHLYDANKRKADKKSIAYYCENCAENSRENAKKEYELWKQRIEKIKMEYELRRTGETVPETNMLYHVIQNLRRRIRRRKISSYEVEEVQNNIK